MTQRDVVTLPGPGGSTVSCCILPCGCMLVLLVGLLLGGIGLTLRLHMRAPLARVAPIARAPRLGVTATFTGR